jgi:cardiolipin synthase
MVIDDEIAMVGTINMDYRSLVHHFENGVWTYNTKSIESIKEDFITTLNQSIFIHPNSIKLNKI